ncbi:sigma-70 family RNA polymerase sigma factor [Endozoicomonas ascidiicola]|uniref:sigma-70 family RNA polymerase sigma factor n=1 Tax=Endozoicomonas ascidiicola TaxID=1698521 RepID=UPI00082CA46C|nr:sigma-70 family RNA polymerase sigma factor [Endozoicomonas ascidiicola]
MELEPDQVSHTQDFRQLLVDLAKHQDKLLFMQLYDYFSPRIKSFLVKKGAAAELAEELVQETMLTVWKKAASYDPEKATASTWLFRIARNLWIDRLRKEKPDLLSPLSVYPETGYTPNLDVCDSGKIKSALDSLPLQQAQLVYKVYYEGKTHREIADDMGMPIGSVKSGLRLAFDKLRFRMGGES